MCGLILLIMLLLQWNARSLIANGQDFKQFIASRREKPDVVCIQETWLKPNLDFVLYGYEAVRRDRREGGGGGCATYVKQGIPYRILGIGSEQEYVVVKVWAERKELVIVNYYNPCKRLELNKLEEIEGQNSSNVVWCGDFNGHNVLWGSDRTDINGQVIEELLDEKYLVCLNDGSSTRIDVNTGKESVLDLTLVSNSIASVCDWLVYQEGTVGSDHYPIWCKINISASLVTENTGGRWILEKANWEKFLEKSDRYLSQVSDGMDIETLDSILKQGIVSAALESIPKSKGRTKKRVIPWWDDNCKEAVRNRNKAFKLVKRTHNFQHMIQYKQAQAVVRRTIRHAKRMHWRKYCDSIGNTTQVGEVWGMIKRMGGDRREWRYPVLVDGNVTAVTNKEKAELLANTFVMVHSSDNLSEKGRRGRERTKAENMEALCRKTNLDGVQDVPFSMGELRKALDKTGKTAPGKDEICYSMIKHLSEGSLEKLLLLYNKVWDEGRIPGSWKEAIIIPIRKPGKDASRPGNYRPIALTSHVCKLMERMINERLVYFLESRGMVATYQSGFRKGRNTMDPVLCLEDEIRKAQVNKETVVAVFFDVEKAYDMLWKEGLLIKLHLMGIGGGDVQLG